MRYGNGKSQNPALCIAEVFPASGGYRTSQCHRKRGHGDTGEYCYQHAKGSKNIRPILNEKVMK